uniref:Uncharacterized protein n=1 Tax=viral metagenome TaxID=1070528 RepID=A0A6M3KPR2_9ZZZZ
MDRESILLIRQYLLGIVAVVEKALGEPLTTSEMRKWFKKFGPPPDQAREQLEG